MFNATKIAVMALAGAEAVNISSQTQASLSATVTEGALAQITFDRDFWKNLYGDKKFKKARKACMDFPGGSER